MRIIKIIIYATESGSEPYSEWQDKLDTETRSIVLNRLKRVRVGNFGDAKRIVDGEGIWELKINYGPGYRIYFGKKGTTIVLLLIGGDKKSQTRDIAKAKQYWLDDKEST